MKKKYFIILQCVGGFLSGLLSIFTIVLSRNDPIFGYCLLCVLIPLLLFGKFLNYKLKKKVDDKE